MGGFRAKGFESLKVQITLERAAFFVPRSVSKKCKTGTKDLASFRNRGDRLAVFGEVSR